jgi:hypothetical protein
MADMHLEYGKGLNLFDTPDMDEGLFIGRETELQDMESILQPHSQLSRFIQKGAYSRWNGRNWKDPTRNHLRQTTSAFLHFHLLDERKY